MVFTISIMETSVNTKKTQVDFIFIYEYGRMTFMARRRLPTTSMKDAVDNKDPYDFCWALLEIARLEWRDKGKFETLSTTDIKNILQAIMSATPQNKEQEQSKTATIHDIKKFLR